MTDIHVARSILVAQIVRDNGLRIARFFGGDYIIDCDVQMGDEKLYVVGPRITQVEDVLFAPGFLNIRLGEDEVIQPCRIYGNFYIDSNLGAPIKFNLYGPSASIDGPLQATLDALNKANIAVTVQQTAELEEFAVVYDVEPTVEISDQ